MIISEDEVKFWENIDVNPNLIYENVFFVVSSGRGVNRDFEMLVEFLSGSSLVHSAIASP